MMDLNLYIAFFAATTIMILLPGPSVMLTVAHSISFGWRRALATVTGATIGVGIQQWRAEPESGPGLDAAPVMRSGRSLLIQGVVVTTANPKSMFFLAAFFPQFIDPVAAPGPQFALLGVTFLAITFGFTALWAVAASHAGGAFRTRRGIRLRNRIAGSLMLGAGLGLALVRRS